MPSSAYEADAKWHLVGYTDIQINHSLQFTDGFWETWEGLVNLSFVNFILRPTIQSSIHYSNHPLINI